MLEVNGYKIEANANLQGADLRDASLWSANLRDANLRDAILRNADLRGADLQGANLQGADLRGADLWGADLRNAKLPEPQCTLPEEGAFVAYKAVQGAVLTLEIPADARRVSPLVGRKCRADKAHVLRAEPAEGTCAPGDSWESKHDPTFVWTVGEMHIEPNYDGDPRVECAPGLHFFTTKKEAQEW